MRGLDPSGSGHSGNSNVSAFNSRNRIESLSTISTMGTNVEGFGLENDTDSVQLYELIWSITHSYNNDASAQDVLLLCYPLVTDAKHILLCLERRFFANDHNGRITVSSNSGSASGCATSVSSMSTGNNTLDSPKSPSGANMGHISFPSDGAPQLNGSPNTPTSALSALSAGSGGPGMPSQTQFDRILSSFPVQARVIKLVRRWMQMYWKKDWENNEKLQDYCRGFGRRILSAYENDDDLEASELDKGLDF